MFRKVPNGLRDVVSGKWGGRELEEYQRLVEWGGCRGNVMCVERAYAHVYDLAHHVEPQEAYRRN